MNLTNTQKRFIERIISKFETASPQGDYSKITIFDDGPGRILQITYGRWQTTEYGNLKKLISDYANAGGIYSAQLKPYVAKIGTTPLTNNQEFIALLRKAGKDDPVMLTTQDAFFKRVYFDPAEQWADANGFSLALSALVIFDSFIHSGSIRKDIRSMFTERPPANGGQEKAWITAYVDARNSWLASRDNPKVQATVYRTKCFQREIKKSNWDLSIVPVVANGTKVFP